MESEKLPDIILKQDKLKWYYCHFTQESEKITWKSFSQTAVPSSELLFFLNKSFKHRRYSLVFPESFSEKEPALQKQVIITTKGCKEIISRLIPKFNDSIFEVEEYITPEGTIHLSLSEPNINKVLRFIFHKKPEHVTLILSNSLSNPLHQNILKNVIEAAGIKTLSVF